MANTPRGGQVTPAPDPNVSPTEAFQGAVSTSPPPPPQEPRVDDRLDRFLERFESRMDEFEDTFGARLERLESAAVTRVAQASASADVLPETNYMRRPPSYGPLTSQQMTGMIPPPTMQLGVYDLDDPVIDTTVTPDMARELKLVNERQVAFIPKDDQLNPKNRTFETFANGRVIRIRRGEVGMLPLGHALDLAKSGHGHVVDITAVHQGALRVQRLPDLSDPDSAGPVVPPEVIARYS